MYYAAIDIGSNAIRLMIAAITRSGSKVSYKKKSLIRIPLRLGDEAFRDKRLSETKAEGLLRAMHEFKHLMDKYDVSDYMACATSAMREAVNGPAIIEEVKDKTGLEIRIIDGKTEAGIISGHLQATLEKKKNYLYIDVGGGSTELSVFSGGGIQASASFNIGTIRLMDKRDSEDIWKEMKSFIRTNTRDLKKVYGIGTGGNINKLIKLSDEKKKDYLSFSQLKKTYDYLRSFSLKERIEVLGLNPDRADVIIPASEIFLSVMEWGGIRKIYVSRKGLADGIISLLIEKNFRNGQ
ncbi:exopolyphosphatase/guanosine-5'-triphosphate,3'-diphosphate pyrophosphatase [Anseongella ginsenosidimutans]|uniref:Exopolyphosphatase/guanosine-5'-triphosphate, 3'-diphosphate pyrophosphatase n=1 Tax=Anseongella ginsenosidimutans TaxID=496056 RepID=A0A4R3KTC1_9SPHI|nr:rod shape-determining protein [Anseongella ginsenosidimutans]QEC53242.1 exopolyphosphatase [Anseongella ginsenosidimutans]TCS87879.1 exopolyphosphatase/guanosine-5'-triphosphate,3'-diphosphate pyrophosphatase [Anseongella ginsenosidimutans]